MQCILQSCSLWKVQVRIFLPALTLFLVRVPSESQTVSKEKEVASNVGISVYSADNILTRALVGLMPFVEPAFQIRFPIAFRTRPPTKLKTAGRTRGILENFGTVREHLSAKAYNFRLISVVSKEYYIVCIQANVSSNSNKRKN
ncbi:hypothetical protein AVEN_48201-1 [Araneus ventricosus]|uniref:Uncharacterized protein n=1 Tax=Araneus ventricosus TaxID=182803 RepID=A0A4Y1ZQX5_ARAVE|nr:hypothetical protein AVEN_48201-1 [Araneus ventricosus]